MALQLSRPGQEAGTGDENANFIKVFAGEVLAAFEQANLLMPLHTVRTISQGKSATMPAVGKASTHWHQAGESVILDQDAQASPKDYLSNIKSVEKEIFIDDPLISSVMVSKIDQLKEHWDSRSQYTTAIGRSLAREADQHILSTVYAGALGTLENIAAQTGTGIDITTHASAKVGADLVGFAFDAAEAMDSRNVPEEGRVLCVRPKGYYTLAQYTNLVNKDLTSGNGGLDSGKVFEVAGFKIVKTNSFGTIDDSALLDTGAKNDPHGANGIGYNPDWLTLGAVAFQTGGVGTVKLKDLVVGSEYLLERLSTLIVAQYAMGHGILRPECCAKMTVTSGLW